MMRHYYFRAREYPAPARSILPGMGAGQHVKPVKVKSDEFSTSLTTTDHQGRIRRIRHPDPQVTLLCSNREMGRNRLFRL